MKINTFHKLSVKKHFKEYCFVKKITFLQLINVKFTLIFKKNKYSFKKPLFLNIKKKLKYSHFTLILT